jgi:hypothetical protein
VQIADDVEVTILTCAAERFIVVRLQVSALSVKPANSIQVTPPGGIRNRPVQEKILGPVRRASRVNDSQ